jgi:glucose/arabinose dehydrogenase
MMCRAPFAIWRQRAWVPLIALAACGEGGADSNVALSGGCDVALVLPQGFCATVFADRLGALRHIVVRPNGDVYIARWEGLGQGGALIALRDTNSDGRADLTRTIPNAGGSGLATAGDFVYMSTWTNVLRYHLRNGELSPVLPPDTIVAGLPKSGHAARSIAIDSAGRLYLAVGAPSNNCQIAERVLRSMGRDPCPERDAFAGIWHYDVSRPGQRQLDGQRFVHGARHMVALAIDRTSGRVYGVQHGRDDLHENFPHLYDERRGQRLPAEAMYRLDVGADYGWPYCYYDDSLRRSVLAPEYGGDGSRTDRCTGVPHPLVAFPAHWAPNGLLFYGGDGFPLRYRGGAYVAFHGGWYRPPPDNGFNIVFVPFEQGQPARAFEIFADGFAGDDKRPSRARHRPVGLAEGPDGALYVTDDARGRVWRITFQGR